MILQRHERGDYIITDKGFKTLTAIAQLYHWSIHKLSALTGLTGTKRISARDRFCTWCLQCAPDFGENRGVQCESRKYDTFSKFERYKCH